MTSTLFDGSKMKTSFSLFAVVILAASVPLQARAEMAQGRVFHDANGNLRYDEGERLLPHVGVSNGKQIVETDEQGRYSLEVDDDAIVFVLKPTGWRTPLNRQRLPQFYYVHKPAGSPESKFPGVAPTGPLPKSIDFPLYEQKEPERFKAIMFGDPQPRNQKELDFIAHDVVAELIGSDAAFGVTLGDIMFDDLSLFNNSNSTVAMIGIPWYNVIGNHDINREAKEDRFSDETFERNFGPAYYSFDHGPVHFLVLDNIDWKEQANGKSSYTGGFDERQLAFVKSDLARVPKEKLVVLMMHIPLVNVGNRQELYRLIEQRPFTMSISGHTHTHEHRYITEADGWRGAEPHHHVINVTVCGSWWGGEPDEEGIPHAMTSDGVPNGYSIVTFDGSKYSLMYKAARRSADYQMNIVLPDSVTATDIATTEVVVNVFNATPTAKVQFQLDDGPWTDMKHDRRVDPLLAKIVAAEDLVVEKTWVKLPTPNATNHIWVAPLPALDSSVVLVRVRATEADGVVYNGSRVLRITP
jgi:hypothetical protein